MEKIKKFILDHFAESFISISSFFGLILWNIISSHLVDSFNRGYLYFFKIDSNYQIEKISARSEFLFFISTILFTIYLLLFIIYVYKNYWNNRKLLSLALVFFITLISFYSFLVCIGNSLLLNIFDMLKTRYLLEVSLAISFITTIICSIEFWILTKSSSTTNETSKILENIKKLFNFSLVLLLILIMFALDSMCYSLGKSHASLEKNYPSFSENSKEYIVIASMKNGQYLTVDASTIQNEPVCIIRDISGLELQDKNMDISPN